ncbi:MAG TPA: hypothetical protein VIS72_11585 [Anaerolineales bacterium]
MRREYYSDTIANFLKTSSNEILGKLAQSSEFALEQTQRDAWLEEIRILQNILQPHKGSIYFEYSIPRMGKRIDVVLLIGSAILVLEFKVGEKEFTSYAIDQVWDYSLDLKNFHETSHECFIAPILIATKAKVDTAIVSTTSHNDKLLFPIKSNEALLSQVIDDVLRFVDGNEINPLQWESGRYQPTPTIIEAAMALYSGHSVSEISRVMLVPSILETLLMLYLKSSDFQKRSRINLCVLSQVFLALGKLWLGSILQQIILIKTMIFTVFFFQAMDLL